jgi:hypothetical protein
MAKNIELKLPSLSKIQSALQKGFGYLLWALFLLLVIWELIIAKNSVGVIFSSAPAPEVSGASLQDSHINFSNYTKAVQRIEQAQTYQPDTAGLKNPFQPGG